MQSSAGWPGRLLSEVSQLEAEVSMIIGQYMLGEQTTQVEKGGGERDV